MLETAVTSNSAETVLGLTLIRLNFLSAASYKHLAGASSSLAEQRCFVGVAADRWRQWFELRKAFESEEHDERAADLAKFDEHEYSQIISHGEWTVDAVIEGDLFLRDIYDEALASVHDVALWSLLDRHRAQIENQMHDVHELQLDHVLMS